MELSDKEIESLRIVAESDCSASWIAERILESYSSYSFEKPQEPHAMVESQPETEPERSLFAL